MDVKQMMPFIAAVVIVVVAGIVLVNWFNYRLRKRVLELGPLDDRLYNLIQLFWKPGIEAMKWGLILLGAGIGLLIIHFIPERSNDLVLDFAIEIIMIALAFLCVYFKS